MIDKPVILKTREISIPNSGIVSVLGSGFVDVDGNEIFDGDIIEATEGVEFWGKNTGDRLVVKFI